MAIPVIRIGVDSFHKLRTLGGCYIDKTAFIEELLGQGPAEVSLITRPRRFGKTLNMSMLAEFFDIRKDSRALFEGLEVSKNRELCAAWMNRYPVVFLSFKDVGGNSFSHARNDVQELAISLCSQFAFLQESPAVGFAEKRILHHVMHATANESILTNVLLNLCRALHAHYGMQVILLVDEYDVPLARAEENGYYREMVPFIRSLLGAALKGNDSLLFGVLTGCLRIAKESIFTGMNNLDCYGISDDTFADSFGFTQEEVERLLADAHLSHKMAEMKEWYDGYRFGEKEKIYCPWDVLKYLKDLRKKPGALPRPYWENTSGNSVVRRFLDRTDLPVKDVCEELVNGGCLETRLVENLTYDSLYSSAENLWSLLHSTGYLTRASARQMADCGLPSRQGTACLVIPNREVRDLFIENIIGRFKDTMAATDRRDLFAAFWDGEAEAFTSQLSDILLTTISYHDYREDFYHAFLVGIFAGTGLNVSSNPESGLGRPDILVTDMGNARAAVIEVKRATTIDELPAMARAAVEQISQRQYDASLQGRFTTIVHWGLAFFGKRCLALFGSVTHF